MAWVFNNIFLSTLAIVLVATGLILSFITRQLYQKIKRMKEISYER